MTTEDTGPGGLYSRLADVGHRPVRFTEEVAIRTAFEDESRPVEICEHIMPGDRWELAYEWAAD